MARPPAGCRGASRLPSDLRQRGAGPSAGRGNLSGALPGRALWGVLTLSDGGGDVLGAEFGEFALDVPAELSCAGCGAQYSDLGACVKTSRAASLVGGLLRDRESVRRRTLGFFAGLRKNVFCLRRRAGAGKVSARLAGSRIDFADRGLRV